MDKSPGDRANEVDLGKYSLVRFKSHGHKFEIVVDPENAWLFKQGEEISIDEIVEGYFVFENFSRGLKANDQDLEEVFGTSEDKVVAMEILKKGELQLTQEQRKEFLREKIEEIVDYLVKNAVNPKTKAPHPASRIEKAIDDAGVRIDRNEDTVEQAKRVIKEIQVILPIKIESATIEFVVPPKDTGRLYGFIQGAGELVNENWGNDGTLTILVRVPAGVVASLLEEVSDISKGRVRATVVDRSE
jgi:ribosome maturation protein SDO1